MRVAVLGGGRSSEHEVSLASAAGVSAGLAQGGHEVVSVQIGRDGRWTHEGAPVTLEPGCGLLGCDVVFPALHGPYGEDGTVQGLLECLDVPYVGSDVAASALCMDKVRFKALMSTAAIAQVEHAGVREADWRADRDGVLARLAPLRLPVFVKPNRLGSSVGISKAREEAALAAALEEAFVHDEVAIVEAAASGLEVEASVLGDAAPCVSPPGEIVLSSAEFYDYAAKYDEGGMSLIVPARIGAGAAEALARIAVEAFVLAGASGLARADFFVDGDRVLLNELNTMPGFTPTSVYAKLWEAGGLPYPALVEQLCAIACERHARTRRHVS